MADRMNSEDEKVGAIEAHRVAAQVGRARRQGLAATLTVEEWLETLDLYGWSCAYCGGPFEIMEHLIPDYFGGGTTQENCRPACKSCNQQKANIDPRMGYMAAPRPFKSKRLEIVAAKARSKKAEEARLAPSMRVLPPLIRYLCEMQTGLTNRRFAQQLGIHESYLSQLYAGKRRGGKKLLIAMARLRPECVSELAFLALQPCRAS